MTPCPISGCERIAPEARRRLAELGYTDVAQVVALQALPQGPALLGGVLGLDPAGVNTLLAELATLLDGETLKALRQPVNEHPLGLVPGLDRSR